VFQFMLSHKPKFNVVTDSVRELLPIYDSEVVKKKTITLTNYVLDKRFYTEITHIYGLLLLRFNYGVNRYLSELFIYMHGMHRRTNYYFFKHLFNLKYVVLCYPAINQIACEFQYSNLKKKFAQNTYWSVSYLHKFPCRGQRRRSNASTPKKLNIVHSFSKSEIRASITTNSNGIKKKNKRK
jgi:hypothetical protein